MNCPLCGTAHPEPATRCTRCASRLPESRCKSCMISIDWGESYCRRCHVDALDPDDLCPACGTHNDPQAGYCEECGSPMGVITRVFKASGGAEQPDPWRVYGVETALIGREQELELLHKTLDDVEERGVLRLALLSGRDGLGKSRLLAEFERRLESSFCKAVILRGACREEVSGAYEAIARMLRAHFYISDSASPASAQRSLAEALNVLVGDEQPHILHHMSQLMGLSGPQEQALIEEPPPRQQEIAQFQAVEAVLRADAKRNPLLFILDDIHLAPDTTLRLLIHLIEALKDVPIFFVFSQLAGGRRVIPPRTAHIELELSTLSDDEVRRQVQDALRLADEIPPELVEAVVDTALGHPLTVEELLRIFIAEGVINTRTEPWQIHGERIAELDLPNTMEAAVEARLQSLTDAERQALEMAACVGNFFWTDLLRGLDGLRLHDAGQLGEPWLADAPGGRRPIDDALESLERKDMIRRQPTGQLAEREEFIFKHRLEREILYQALSTDERERYHRFIAQWMERESRASGDGTAEFIARHFARAGLLDRAAARFLDAGDLARRRHANQQAIELYSEALNCLSDADMSLKMRAYHDLGSVHELLGEHEQARRYYGEMARYAWLLGDRAKGGAALNKLGRALRGVGSYDEALAHLERALQLFRHVNDERGVASTLDDLGKIHWIRGSQDRAFDYYSASLRMRRDLGDKRSIAVSLSNLGSLKLQRGELREAMLYFREALELRKDSQDRQGLAGSYNDMGGLCAEQGKFDEAILLFQESLQIAREIGFRGLEAAALNNIGECQMALKNYAESRENLLKAREIASQIDQQRVLFDVLRNLAHQATKEADRALALERISQALTIAEELNSQALLANGELTRAEIHAETIFDPTLREESIREANQAFIRAIDLFQIIGSDPQRAHALAAYGNFLLESDDIEQGRQALNEARQLFLAIGMKRYAAQVEEVLARLG